MSENSESTATPYWLQILKKIISTYNSEMLHKVGKHLLNHVPKSQEFLIQEIIAAVHDEEIIIPRLEKLNPTQRTLLSLISYARISLLAMDQVIDLTKLLDLDHSQLQFMNLIHEGLIYLLIPEYEDFDDFHEDDLFDPYNDDYYVHLPPLVGSHVQAELIPVLPHATEVDAPIQETDGYEFLIRHFVLWQEAYDNPIRMKRGGGFYERDRKRLLKSPAFSPLLNGHEPNYDMKLLLTNLGLQLGFFQIDKDKLKAVPFHPNLPHDLTSFLKFYWAVVALLYDYESIGMEFEDENLYSHTLTQCQLIIIAYLVRLPSNAWLSLDTIAERLCSHHLKWEDYPIEVVKEWLDVFLIGIAYQLGMIQLTTPEEDVPYVRLSALGRSIFGLQSELELPEYPKTLLVQPNLELIVYRQGLTPGLLIALTKIANWKSIGSACTLQLQAESIYRGLQSGFSSEDILSLLSEHSVQPLPKNVAQMINSWSDKRDRLSVYSATTLIEFQQEEDLQRALDGGLAGIPISNRMIMVPEEEEIDYAQFRLVSTRDYTKPNQPCVELAADGVTLEIDLKLADLLLETELQQFAECVSTTRAGDRSTYRITPKSIQQGKKHGLLMSRLEEWFLERTGEELPAVIRLFFNTLRREPLTIQKQLVVLVSSPAIADGLTQWTETQSLIEQRIGPQALMIAEENVQAFQEKLSEIGMPVQIVDS